MSSWLVDDSRLELDISNSVPAKLKTTTTSTTTLHTPNTITKMRLFSRSKKPKSSSDLREPEHEHALKEPGHNEYLEKPKNEDDTKPPIPAKAIQKWKCDRDYEAAFRDLEEELQRELLSPHPNAIPRIIQNKRANDKAEWIINATFQRQQRLRELKSRMRMQHEDECLKDREILEKSTPPSSSPDESIQARLTREIMTLLRTRNVWIGNLTVLFMENRSCAHMKLRVLARQHCN